MIKISFFSSHHFKFGELATDSAHDSLLKQPYKVYLDGGAHRWPCAFVGFGGAGLRLGAGWGCSAQMIFSNDA